MSLKGDKYETQEEVKFRLEGSVVLYDEKPVYITRVQHPEDENEIARVYFRELPYGGGLGDNKESRKYLSSKKFDLAPFRMGYMNHKGAAIFVSRAPVRQNKQGLSIGVTSFADVRGQKSGLINFPLMIASQGFVDMFYGKYPDFKQVGDLIGNTEEASVAVSRSFAFYIDHDLESLYLLNKGVKCGIVMKGDRGLKIPPKYHFLRQEMEEHRIPLA